MEFSGELVKVKLMHSPLLLPVFQECGGSFRLIGWRIGIHKDEDAAFRARFSKTDQILRTTCSQLAEDAAIAPRTLPSQREGVVAFALLLEL